MGFNIPMTTSGAMDSNSLLNQYGSNQTNNVAPQPQQQPQQAYNPQPQAPQYNQPQAQQYNQPQQNFNNQPQQNFNQPQQNFNQPQAQTQYNQPAAQPKQRPAGGGVHLKKGQKFAIAGAGGAQLQRIRMCLGWDLVNQACDLDASAFMLDQNNRIIGDDWFVFYGQTNSPDGSIVHSGDSQGEGAGDDEVIDINLMQVNPNVQKITFVVTINEALEQGLNFSMVANAYVRIVDATNNSEIARFNLTDYYSNVTAMVVGELYRHNGAWKFNSVGDGVAKDLAGLCAMYGVNVAD